MTRLTAILENFTAQVRKVNRLLELDDLVVGETIKALEERQEGLKKHAVDNAYHLAENTLQHLRNIRESDSLKPGYKLLHNQCVVLLVSYFSSAAHDIFDSAATSELVANASKEFRDKDIKFTLGELKEYKFDLSKDIGSIVSTKFDISFQDMASITRAFNDFYGVDIPWDRRVNNIIATQACRHAIAHAGEVADRKLINQLRNSADRDIQEKIQLGDTIQFSPTEIQLAGNEMSGYLNDVVKKIEEKGNAA